MRVNENANESCVRFQPKALSSATIQRPMAWNIGVLDKSDTNPLIPTSHQP
jgi:hypothetical protein